MKLEQFLGLAEEDREGMFDEASSVGTLVYSRDYDSGAPGGGGCDSVYRYRGLFFVSSLDDLDPGPYRSLRDAIDSAGLAAVTSAVGEIVCAGMKAERLVRLLEVFGNAEPIRIRINDESWSYDEKSGWTRCPTR